MSWSDRGSRSQLAAALDMVGDRAPVVTLAAKALRDGETSHELADGLDDHAYLIAIRYGNYDAHGVCSDAAEALRTEHDGTCYHGHPHCNPAGDKCGDECM